MTNVSKTLKVLLEIRDVLLEHGTKLDHLQRSIDQLSGRIDNVLLGSHRDEHVELRRRVERIEKHLGFED